MVLQLHEINSWLLIATNLVAGLWALVAHFRPELRHKALWVLVAVAQILCLTQVVTGVIRLSQMGIRTQDLHMFYGFLCLVCVGILYGYRTQLRDHVYLLYSGGSLFIMGMAIRAFFLPPFS